MIIHRLESEQIVTATLERCWEFFSSPKNLSVITPPDLDFVVLSKLPKEVYAGLFIEYRVRPLLGIAVTWVTEITQVRAPHYFCDEQRHGPYRIWHHEHFFEELNDGKIRLRDRVHYSLPFSPLSDIVHPRLVMPRLKAIFDFRRQKITELFG